MDFEEMVAIGLGLPVNRLGDFAVEWEGELFTVPAFVKANLQTEAVVDAIFEQPLDAPFTLPGAQPFVLRRIRGRLKIKQRRVRVGNEDVTLFRFLLDNQENIEVIQNVLSLPLGQTLTWPVQAGLSLDITVYEASDLDPERYYTVESFEPGGGIVSLVEHVKGKDVARVKRSLSQDVDGVKLRYRLLPEGFSPRRVTSYRLR